MRSPTTPTHPAGGNPTHFAEAKDKMASPIPCGEAGWVGS